MTLKQMHHEGSRILNNRRELLTLYGVVLTQIMVMYCRKFNNRILRLEQDVVGKILFPL